MRRKLYREQGQHPPHCYRTALLVAIIVALMFGTPNVWIAPTSAIDSRMWTVDTWTECSGYATISAPLQDPFSIQAAIDAAEPGDTIVVAAGTYNPNATIVIDKDNLVIKGPQADVDPRPSMGSLRTAGSEAEAIIDGGTWGLKEIKSRWIC